MTLADRSAAVGRTLRDLALPVDDEVLVVTSEGSEGQVRELLVGEGEEEEEEAPEPAERGLQ